MPEANCRCGPELTCGCQFLLAAGADRTSQRPGMAALGQPRYAFPAPAEQRPEIHHVPWHATHARSGLRLRGPGPHRLHPVRVRVRHAGRATDTPQHPGQPRFHPVAGHRLVVEFVFRPHFMTPRRPQVNCPQPTGCSTGISSVPQATGHIGDWVLGMNGYGLIYSLPASSGPSSSPRPASSLPSPPPRLAPQSGCRAGAAGQPPTPPRDAGAQPAARHQPRPPRRNGSAPHSTDQLVRHAARVHL